MVFSNDGRQLEIAGPPVWLLQVHFGIMLSSGVLNRLCRRDHVSLAGIAGGFRSISTVFMTCLLASSLQAATLQAEGNSCFSLFLLFLRL